jgi:hypothetical protein
VRRRFAALLALVACALSGCGFGGDDEVTERVQQPSLLTKEDVQRLPEGSPARTTFEWWRTLQFDNPVLAVEFYDDDLGITVERLERQLKWGAGSLGLTQKPVLVEVQERGNEAAVLVLLENQTTNPNGRVDKTRTARSFNLIREGGEWKLAENLYLERQARTQQLFAAVVRQQENPSGQQQGQGGGQTETAPSP